MSKRYWRILFAIAGVIAATSILVVSYDLYRASEQRRPNYEYQPVGHPALGVDSSTKSLAKLIQPNCQSPNNHEDADLCAQWAAVHQAAESNRMASINLRMAILSMILTSVATAFLVWTFYEGRQTTRRELRAYLCLRPVLMEKITVSPAPHLTITMPIENTGSTPANQWQIQWAWQVTKDAPTAQMFSDLMAKYPLGEQWPDFSFGPKQLKENPVRIPITNEWRAKVVSGEMKFYFLGRIHYVDAFDTRRVTEFFYYYTEELPNRMGQVQFGNKIA